jgi:hypothetical protein
MAAVSYPSREYDAQEAAEAEAQRQLQEAAALQRAIDAQIQMGKGESSHHMPSPWSAIRFLITSYTYHMLSFIFSYANY